MKKSFLTGILLVGAGALGSRAQAQTTLTGFTAGDIVVERIGDGTAALTSAGTAIFLDEFTPTGNLVGSYELPTAGTTPLVESGTASSGGELGFSADGRYLLVPGYDAAAGTTGVTGATATAVPREVATLSASLGLAQTTLNAFSANNIRSATSPDGTTLFVTGANTGVLTATAGGTGVTPTNISSTSTNNRGVAIYGGQLYLSSGSGTFRVASVGTGVSTATGQTATELAGITSTNVNSPYAFVVTSLTLNSTAPDTVYVADNGNNVVQKFSLAGGTYTLTGTVAVTGVTGLTGVTIGTTETLYATSPTGLYLITDATGQDGTLSGAAALLVSASTNEAFRGIAFAPSAVPEPSTYALLLLAGCGIYTVTRRRTQNLAV